MAVDILKELPHVASDDGFVFTVNGKPVSGFSTAKARLDKLLPDDMPPPANSSARTTMRRTSSGKLG
jgi:hypothetical protein